MPPSIIEKLEKLTINAEKKLNPEHVKKSDIPKIDMNEKVFRWMQNEEEIGNEKLADGIRIFAKGIKIY